MNKRGIPGSHLYCLREKELLRFLVRLVKSRDSPLINDSLMRGVLVDDEKTDFDGNDDILIVNLPRVTRGWSSPQMILRYGFRPLRPRAKGFIDISG